MLSHQGFILINLAVTYSHMGISQDSASVHACAYLVQARTLEPSFYFLKSAVIFSNVFQPQKHVQNLPHFFLSKLHINLLPQSFRNALQKGK